MYSTRNEYDRGVNTFSPEGRLFQIEYALGAIKLGSTSVGIKTNEGVVIVTERRLQSKLMETTHDAEKIKLIDNHIGCVSSGIIADSLILIDHAQVQALHHNFVYDEPILAESCVNSIAEIALSFSGIYENEKKTISRPFGVVLMLASVDKTGPSLWCVDPSGTTTKYEAAAIGAVQEGAETYLQEKYREDLTLKEAEEICLVVLRHVMEEKLSATNVEVGSITTETKKFRIYSVEEVQQLVDKLPDTPLVSALSANS